MNDWDDLLLSGGFAPRAKIFAGLTLEQVSLRPHGVAHSIYQELWHAATVLKMSLDNGRVVLETWPPEQHFPTSPAPADGQAWNDLVSMFLTQSHRAVELAKDDTWLNAPEPGYPQSTWRDGLEFLAVHTAYHMGKVVCLRQIMGNWHKGPEVSLEPADTLEFSGELMYWRGPAPHYFVRVPEDECRAIKAVSKLVTYGWGMIPVYAIIGATRWKTSLFPKNGGYLVPVTAQTRKCEGLEEGQLVAVKLEMR